jgi:hypothetical protein
LVQLGTQEVACDHLLSLSQLQQKQNSSKQNLLSQKQLLCHQRLRMRLVQQVCTKQTRQQRPAAAAAAATAALRTWLWAL